MNPLNDLEKCFSFINCQLQSARPHSAREDAQGYRAVTISRQSGSGGHSVAEKLAQYLPAQDRPEAHSWAVFDRNLVEKVLEDHHLPGRLAKFMPEDRVSETADIMDDLFGLHPPSWELVRQTSETMLHLAELGHVILIGRGANIVTSRLPHVFHVRLVGTVAKRAQRLQEREALSKKEALKKAEREDLARQRYLKQFFGKNIDDPLLYHLVLNTDLLSTDEAAQIIATAMAAKHAWTPQFCRPPVAQAIGVH